MPHFSWIISEILVVLFLFSNDKNDAVNIDDVNFNSMLPPLRFDLKLNLQKRSIVTKSTKIVCIICAIWQ